MRPLGTASELERRRIRALTLYRKEKIALREIARRLDCSASSVHRWVAEWKRHGSAGLRPKAVAGRPAQISPSQLRKLERVLSKGAMNNGFATEFWTLMRIRQVIKREFGVSYHISHVARILEKIGWSCQIPERRAIQRDEEAIRDWLLHRWPTLKKSPRSFSPLGLP
jgi:transposase